MTESRELAVDLIREMAHESKRGDPHAGIFGNQELADELRRAASLLESYGESGKEQLKSERISVLEAALRRVNDAS